MPRPSRVTDTDVALLRSVGQLRSVVAASREIGISRDRAVYRIGRLARAFGGPVVRSERGGRGHGGTVLTALGDRVLEGGFDSVEMIDARSVSRSPRPNVLRGVYRAGAPPEVAVDPELRLRVAFRAREGEPVRIAIDPESIVVARRRFPSSARNVVRGRVDRLERGPRSLDRVLWVRVGAHRIRVALTDEPVRELGLRPGTPVLLYLKATAVRRLARGDGRRGLTH
jgi:molybdate transport system regulatory protein